MPNAFFTEMDCLVGFVVANASTKLEVLGSISRFLSSSKCEFVPGNILALYYMLLNHNKLDIDELFGSPMPYSSEITGVM